MIDVLALLPYPREAAAARFRMFQMVEPLARRGVTLDLHCLLDRDAFDALYGGRGRGSTAAAGLAILQGAAGRVALVPRARRADVVLVQREALIGGPPVIEWLIRRAGGRIVLDLDDATYVGYDSPTYGRLGRLLKWPGKTRRLIDTAAMVTCGNHVVEEYVRSCGVPARLVRTVVDTDLFRPRPRPRPDQRAGEDDRPLVGWIGTHSTFPYLASLREALAEVARTHPFRLLVVGSGTPRFDVLGVDVECRPWSLEREVEDFNSLDIGLYPLPDDEWAAGKSALKSIQYLAVGVPFVVSPVGAAAEIGVAGVTHLEAKTEDDWVGALRELIGDASLRARLGRAGREHALAHHHLDGAADAFATALTDAARMPR